MQNIAEREQEFFGRILKQAIEDASSPKPIMINNDITREDYDARLEARMWLFKNYPESNFAETCRDAGVDPDEFRTMLKIRRPEIVI